MAQNLGSMYVCRSCRRYLQNVPTITRSFSSSIRHNKGVPVFAPTKIAEFDEIMLTYREKVFIPEALSKHHRKLIYATSMKDLLINEPGVTVTLSDGEEIKLKPMDRFDRPNKQKSLKEIGDLLGNSTDGQAWGNLSAFLGAMLQAKQNVPVPFYEKITRKANEMGKAGVIIQCAEQVKKTGFKLSIPQVTRELILGCHIRAAEASFHGDDFLKAAKQAETIAFLLERDGHCGGKLKPGEVDMRQDLLVLAIMLEMAAAKAVNVNGGNDANGQVANLVTKVLAATEKGLKSNSSVFIQPELQKSKDETDKAIAEMVERRLHLEDLLPLWNGLKLVARVEGVANGQLEQPLKTRLREVEKEVKETRAKVQTAAEGKPKRVLLMYDALV